MSMSWWPAYVGLGSNLDDPEAQVSLALDALARLPQSRRVACSGLYRSAPMGPIDQPDFVNAAAGLVTRLGPAELLDCLLALERALGRERGGQRWGPRRIDLDLLLYGNLTLREEALELPHPGISERSFVLYPLCELAPELWVPGRGRVVDLAAALGSSGLERIA